MAEHFPERWGCHKCAEKDKRVTELEAEVADLTRKGEDLCVQNGSLLVDLHPLRAFVQWAIDSLFDEFRDMDSDDIQKCAVKHGLIALVPGEYDDDGDPCYERTPRVTGEGATDG